MNYSTYKGLNLPAIADEILQKWKEENLFQQSVENRKDSKPFVFYEGPPSANGVPGIHHVMARTIKDMFCRYKTLDGYRVDRKGGWDTPRTSCRNWSGKKHWALPKKILAKKLRLKSIIKPAEKR